MRKTFYNIIKIFLLLVVSFYIFHEIDIKKLQYAIESYSYVGLFYVILITLVADVIYAYRWVYLSKNKCTLTASFEATILSTILNLILPAKLGEISRVVYLKKIYGQKINNSISLLVVEKFFDLILLAIISAMATTFIFNNENITILSYILIIFIFVFFALIKTNIALKISAFIPVKFLRVYSKKITIQIYKNFSYRNLLNIFTITVTIWIVYFFTEYIFFNYVTNFNLSIYQVFVVFVVSVIAFSLPVTPGGIGIYEASIIMSLGWYGVDKESALMAGLSLRFIHMLMMMVISWVILLNKDLTIFKLKKLLT